MNHMQRREQLRGIALTIIGGIFWGLAGVCGQYLFEERGLTAKACKCAACAGWIDIASDGLGKTKKADV